VLAVLATGLAHDHGPARFSLSAVGFEQLQGWPDDRLTPTIAAFVKSCTRLRALADNSPIDMHTSVDFGRVGNWRGVCKAAESISPDETAAARRFFEDFFVPLAVADYGEREGLFTGYYEIELNGSLHHRGRYQTPIYRRPPELGSSFHYSRAEIEDGALVGRGLELFWVDNPIDAFFLQIQGSGRIRLRNGGIVRVGYDGQNGQPYVAVGRLLIERGAIARSELTMATIRAWMSEHPAAAALLRRENPSYVFFREIKGDGPIGAEGVALTPERSIAVDRAFIPLGVPIWVEADERFANADPVRRLVVAQDTGGAIRGPVRGDFFWGSGGPAGLRAGVMNARGRYYLLLPRAVADRVLSMPE
jgi:membrane-bound lytic murein transglycosylase A